MDVKSKAELFEVVIDALAHLIAGEERRQDAVWPKATIAVFDGFELLDGRLVDDDDDEFVLLGRDAGDAPVWPMDARWAGYFQGGWNFKRVSTLDPKKWRGRLSRVMPKMYEVAEARIAENASSTTTTSPFAVVNGRLIDALAHNHSHSGRNVAMGDVYGAHFANESDALAVIRLSHGIEMRRECLWSVLMGEEGVPRARFVTDPIGVREAFRLRDLPAGRVRRAALRHWVSEHWRKRRSVSANDRSFIQAFLRGATEFRWSGLSCVIEPSRDDVRRSLKGKAVDAST